MVVATADFAAWLEEADIAQRRLTPQQQAVLQAAFSFRQAQGSDYFSTRLLSHFLLHCHLDLKVSQVARLVGISRPTASCQQGLSSRQVIHQAHNRLRGRPYGKLLPRFAGPIAGFLLGHPDATRAGLIDFVFATFGVRVSRVALYKFLKKYGLDRVASPGPTAEAASLPHGPPPATTPAGPVPVSAAPASPPEAPPGPVPAQTAVPAWPQSPAASAGADLSGSVLLPGPTLLPAPPPAPPFSSRARSTRAPSC